MLQIEAEHFPGVWVPYDYTSSRPPADWMERLYENLSLYTGEELLCCRAYLYSHLVSTTRRQFFPDCIMPGDVYDPRAWT